MGTFNSDRAFNEYAEIYWNIEHCPVPSSAWSCTEYKMCVDTIIVLLCYPSTLSSTISPRTPRSRDSISPSKISCSGLRNKLPGLPVTIEGDMLPTEITDEFGGMLPAKLWYETGGEWDTERTWVFICCDEADETWAGGGIEKPYCEWSVPVLLLQLAMWM